MKENTEVSEYDYVSLHRQTIKEKKYHGHPSSITHADNKEKKMNQLLTETLSVSARAMMVKHNKIKYTQTNITTDT